MVVLWFLPNLKIIGDRASIGQILSNNIVLVGLNGNVQSLCLDLFIWGFTSLSTLFRSYHDG